MSITMIKEILNKIIKATKRIRLELFLLSLIAIILFAIPIDWKQIGLQLFLYKVLLFSASQIHAVAFRRVYWQGKKAKTMMDKVMAVAIHVSSAYLYATGG